MKKMKIDTNLLREAFNWPADTVIQPAVIEIQVNHPTMPRHYDEVTAVYQRGMDGKPQFLGWRAVSVV